VKQPAHKPALSSDGAEVAAIAAVLRALEALPPESQARVLWYVTDRLVSPDVAQRMYELARRTLARKGAG
jgi:hypothetical protein